MSPLGIYLTYGLLRLVIAGWASFTLAHTFSWWPATTWSVLALFLLAELFGRNPWMKPPR